MSQSPNTIARKIGAVYEIPDYGDARLTNVLRSGRNGHVYGQVLTNRVGCRPVADVYRSCKVLNQRAMGPQLRQPRRDGGHNLMARHVNRTSFVQAISDPIHPHRRSAGCVLGRDMLREPPFVIVVVSAAGSFRRQKRVKYGYAALRPG